MLLLAKFTQPTPACSEKMCRARVRALGPVLRSQHNQADDDEHVVWDETKENKNIMVLVPD